MSDRNQVSSSQYDAQFVLIVITALLQLFQTIVMGAKLRIRCRDCFFSWRPKGSSPGGSSDGGGSPTKPAADDAGPVVAAAAAADAAPEQVSLSPRTVAAVVAAAVAATTPRTSISLSEVHESALRVPHVGGCPQTPVAERSRTLSGGDCAPSAVRRARTPSATSAPSPSIPGTVEPSNNRKRSSAPPPLEAVVIDEQN